MYFLNVHEPKLPLVYMSYEVRLTIINRCIGLDGLQPLWLCALFCRLSLYHRDLGWIHRGGLSNCGFNIVYVSKINLINITLNQTFNTE